MSVLRNIQQAAEHLDHTLVTTPKAVVVLGSGLGDYADDMEQAQRIPYEDIPGFASSSVPGHKGQLVVGVLHGLPVAVMQGRLHYYEGYDQNVITVPIRALRLLGAQVLVLTNAAGGVNPDYSPGDLMLIEDHINLSGASPLRGENIEMLGPRFPDMTQAYDDGLKQMMRKSAKKGGIDLKSGIYAMFAGPQFETPAEIRFARIIGADAVGMSTVPEVIAARHGGMRICAVSCITNMAAGILDKPLSHQEVLQTGRQVKDKFSTLINGFLALLSA